MGSGGGGTGRGADQIGASKPTPIRAVGKPQRTRVSEAMRDGEAQRAVRTQAPIGSKPAPSRGGLVEQSRQRRQGFTDEERRMRSPQRGLSPGDVLATVGSSGYGQVASTKLSGRTDITTEGLGDLARRVNIGQMPAGRVTVPGVGSAALNVLNVAGQKTASTILDKLIAGEKAVTDTSGRIMGTTDERGVYTGRPDFDPTQPKLEKGSDPEPVITPEVTPEIVPDDTEEASTIVSRGKRRTRGKRSGLAGKDEEYGILVTT